MYICILQTLRKSKLHTLLESEEVNHFLYSIKSEQTKANYIYNLGRFVEFIKIKASDFLKLDRRSIEDHIIKYVISMRDSNLSYSTILARVSPIMSLLDLNNVIVNKKKIARFYGDQRKTVKDLAYSHEDITKMLRVGNFKTRVIVLIYASTGIRRSAIIDLKLKHLEKIPEHNMYKVTVYEGTNEEYITFLTPEASKAVDDYLEKRKLAGENISSESYLIRNNFDRTDIKSVLKVKPINVNTLIDLLRALLLDAGLRGFQTSRHKRHEKAIMHAFRKFVMNQFVKSKINAELREMMLGHKIGLASVYYRPTDDEILKEYIKAIPNLTIDDSERIQKQLEKVESEKSRIELMESNHRLEIQNLQKQIETMKPTWEIMKKHETALQNLNEFMQKLQLK